MLSFDEKKEIFRSFDLVEKEMSNGKLSYHYPKSKQRGQVLATQLHTTGNGYVIGKYMSEEIVIANDFQVDSRGWISIKEFSKEELKNLISHAMDSMLNVDESEQQEPKEESPTVVQGEQEVRRLNVDKQQQAVENKVDSSESQSRYTPCFFYWVGVTKSILRFQSTMWNEVRKTFNS